MFEVRDIGKCEILCQLAEGAAEYIAITKTAMDCAAT